MERVSLPGGLVLSPPQLPSPQRRLLEHHPAVLVRQSQNLSSVGNIVNMKLLSFSAKEYDNQCLKEKVVLPLGAPRRGRTAWRRSAAPGWARRERRSTGCNVNVTVILFIETESI